MNAPANPVKDWLTASEIAELELRDMPVTRKGVTDYAIRHNWNDDFVRSRPRAGRGGGMEYHVSLLPTMARMQYEQRTMVVGAVEPIRPPKELPVPETDRARRAQAARVAILTAWERYNNGLLLGPSATGAFFAIKYNVGEIAVEEWVRQEVPEISKRSLFRWRSAARDGKSLGADRSLARKGKGLLETANGGAVRHFILGLIAHQPLISVEAIMTLTSGKFGGTLTDAAGELRELPSIRTFQHQIKAWKASDAVALAKLSDPDWYRSTMAPSGVGVLRHITAPNQLWMIDASPLDALDSSVSRLTVYACIDIGTRRTVLYISPTPRASAVALLLRKAILAWGVPQKIKTDNGSDFVAEDSKRLLAALGIELELSDAYSPQQKGHVERVIRTMQHGFAELLPGYVGHNVAERKRLEDRKGFAQRLGAETAELFGVRFTMAEIQALADRWIDVVYEQRPHKGLGGRSPAQAAREANAVVRTVDVRALDMLLMPVPKNGGYRKVTKFGVQVGEYYYQTMRALPGDRVMVRMDPHDAGLVYLFAESDGAYVEPALCPELAGVDPADYQRMVKEKRAAILKEKTDPIRAEVRQLTSGTSMIELYLAEKQRQLSQTAQIISLPARTVEHVTPEIAAALTAATGETPVLPAEAPLAAPPADVITFQPRPLPAGARPAFKTDQEMAGWLVANPEAITDRDRALMADRLRSWTFRELCSVAGVDVESLSTLIKSKKNEAQS